MDPIYITGHKNPDMDSACAATAYAELKNHLDRSSRHVAVRPGRLNAQTRFAFEAAGVEVPKLLKDVHPRVSDVAKRNIVSLKETDPIKDAISALDSQNLSVIPIFKEGAEFLGIVTIHEITKFLVSETLGGRPEYLLSPENIEKVIPGFFYRKNSSGPFRASVMAGAMTYEDCKKRIDELEGLKPILVVGVRQDLVEFAVEQEFPLIILTGWDGDGELPLDFGDYSGMVYVSGQDTAETIRLLRLSAPVISIADTEPRRLPSHMDFDEAKGILVGSELRGLPVFEGEVFCGIVTRRCFIEKPRKRLILVDHNELSQSLPGALQAEIVEIIDHHRLGAEKTRFPIFLFAKPVGSTCTIISQLYRDRGVKPSKATALLLLSGILSDTVMLHSPTTTEEDRLEVQGLGDIAGVDPNLWGGELVRHSTDLANSDPSEILKSDLKVYRHDNLSVGIGQVEVLTLENLDEFKDALWSALDELKREKGLTWAMILVTDVMKQNSRLLTSGEEAWESLLVYQRLGKRYFDLPDIISRKKQLLPEILRVLEDQAGKTY